MTPPQKGTARVADIPADVLAQLHAGTRESRTLAEGLAIDFALLAEAAIPDLPASDLTLIRESADRGVTRRMELLGAILLRQFGLEALDRFAKHTSDTVRGWACFALGHATKLKLKERLALARPLADDPHFGVREWAWLPLRPHLAANIGHTVKVLRPWTAEASPFLRRFAVEATRPRGVWASHIQVLKDNPALGLPLLEPLKTDPERYVQDSVANWLNDAGKSKAAWVREVCQRWREESTSEATAYIVKRAGRNLGGR